MAGKRYGATVSGGYDLVASGEGTLGAEQREIWV